MSTERRVGTVSRGIRCPIFREGDDLAQMVVDSVLEAAASDDGFEVKDRDIVCITESVVARCQGNYASVEEIAADVKAKLGGKTVGVIWPILSRNRFAICLRGISMGAEKVVLMLSYPSDEVGNALLTMDQIDESGVNPYSDVLTEKKYRELFGENKHQFTGVDYVSYYGDLIRATGAEAYNEVLNAYFQSDDFLELFATDDNVFIGGVTYLSINHAVDVEECRILMKALMKKSEKIASRASKSTYLVTDLGNKDNFDKMLRDMMCLTITDHIIYNYEYTTIIEDHAHFLMGRNPDAINYVTTDTERTYQEVGKAGIAGDPRSDSMLIFMLSVLEK